MEEHLTDGTGAGRRPPRPLLCILILVALPAAFLPACGPTVPTSAPSRASIPSRPLPSPGDSTPGSVTPPPAPVVLIVLENHGYSSIVGSPSAPYLNSLIPRGRLFTHYLAVAHPSLPNYLAMTSGSTQGMDGTDAIAAGGIAAQNLFHQLSRAGVPWASFQESMPSRCFRGPAAGAFPDDYALKHDPAMAYRDVADTSLCRWVRPLSALRARALPSFSFVSPDECHDMHSCPVRAGDAWLAATVPALLRAGAVVIVTFDEGVARLGGGGRVMTLEVGPGVPQGVRDGRPYDHYGLLSGLERSFHVPLLGNARSAVPLPV